MTKTKWLWYGLAGIYVVLFLPFWKPIILGAIFAAAFMPVVDRIRKKFAIPRGRSAYGLAGTVITFAFLILGLATVQLYSTTVKSLKDPEIRAAFSERWQTVREKVTSGLTQTKILPSNQLRVQIESSLTTVATHVKQFLATTGEEILVETPDFFLQTVIFFLVFGVILVGGNAIWLFCSDFISNTKATQTHFREFQQICSRTLASIFLVGFVQALLATVGSSIAGFGNWQIVFIVTFVASMIPVVGAGIIPALLCLIGYLDDNTSAMVIMLITAVIVGSADNVLRAWLFSRAAKINPAISLISLLGALKIFGFVGLFISPVLEQLVMLHFFSDKPKAA